MSQSLHLNKINYFDNCATTQVSSDVQEIVSKYNICQYFNPAAQYSVAVTMLKEVEEARQNILKNLGASNGKLIFTSGGTEAVNLAIRCINTRQGKIISTQGEHSAAYNTLKILKDNGCDVEFLGIKPSGAVDIDLLIKNINEKTAGVVITHVNSETGAINDIRTISKRIKEIEPNCVIICDGVQAVGKIALNMDQLNVDAYALSGHKIHAPKGVGALWVKNINKLSPLIVGSSQEYDKRGGTLNVSGIMALEKAIESSVGLISELDIRCKKFKQVVLDSLREIDHLVICPDAAPNILTLAFSAVQGETLMHMLATNMFIVGIGSACNSKIKLSRGIAALNLAPKYQNGVIRISFSKFNTLEQVNELASCIVKHLGCYQKGKNEKSNNY